MEVARRRLIEPPEKLTITRAEGRVTITDGHGGSATLNTDGKKQPRVTGDGEFISKTHFTGLVLVVEEDFGGPKVTTTYTPTLDAGDTARLEVTVKVEGLRGPGGRGGGGRGGPVAVTRIYDRQRG